MTTTLTVAHTELFRRPREEQFGSFEEMRTAATEQRRCCDEVESREKAILFSDSGEVHFGDQHTLSLTHYSMGQLAAMARVPLPVLARLKPETRASVLNQSPPTTRRLSEVSTGSGRST